MMRFWEVIKRMHLINKCLLCGEAIPYDDDSGFCVDCAEEWKELLNVQCVKCGYKMSECACIPKMIKQTSNYGYVTCVFYSPKSSLEANHLIFKLKRDFNRDLINYMAKMMVKNLRNLFNRHGLDFNEFTVTYVTRRTSGVRKYGFDHTKYLAKAVAKNLGIECQRTLLNVGELEQKSLTKAERLENAQSSFEINEKIEIKGRKYILVDDIITSGATMKACADLLKENGAEEIIPVSFAKDN